MSILWKNKCFYINFWLQIPMWLIVYNTQNSFAPQMKNVKLRWGKKKIFKMFECPGSALLIDTNFTYEKSRYPFQLKSLFLWTFTNDLSWILLIDACTKNIFYCKYLCILCWTQFNISVLIYFSIESWKLLHENKLSVFIVLVIQIISRSNS